MSALRNVEDTIGGFVERVFGRLFRGHVEPVELARKLAREMEDHKTVSVTRVYVPNEYVVYLSGSDRARFASFETSLCSELGIYVAERARHEGLTLLSPPVVRLETDADLRVGEYGIACRVVDPPSETPVEVDASAPPTDDPPPAPATFTPAAPQDAEVGGDAVDGAPQEPGGDEPGDSGDDASETTGDADPPAVGSVPGPPAGAVAGSGIVAAAAIAGASAGASDTDEAGAEAPAVDESAGEGSEPDTAGPDESGVPDSSRELAGAHASVVPPPPAPAPTLPPPGGYEPLAGVSGTQIISTAEARAEGFAPEELYLLVEGRRHRISARATTIGRSRDCDIVLSDANASRRHAEIRHIGLDYFVVDLGSTNGTIVNGQRVRRHALANGDRILIGTSEILVEHAT